MGKIKLLLGALVLLLASCGGGESSEVEDTYDFYVTINGTTNSSDTLQAHYNSLFKLPKKDINIEFRNCGVSNAFYSSAQSTITICQELAADLFNFYGNYDDSINAMEFVTYHELAHAFVDQFDLPVFGNLESAADSIAVVLKVEIDGDARSAIIASVYFLGNQNTNWADSHPLGGDRFYDISCLALGADSSLLNEQAFFSIAVTLAGAGRNCPAEYQIQEESINSLLANYLK